MFRNLFFTMLVVSLVGAEEEGMEVQPPERPLVNQARWSNTGGDNSGATVSPEAKECRERADGSDYRGQKSTTRSGYVCQDWGSSTPTRHYFTSPSRFGVSDISQVKNFCRNPNKSPDGVWCFISTYKRGETTPRYEFCDVPLCQDKAAVKPIDIPEEVNPPNREAQLPPEEAQEVKQPAVDPPADREEVQEIPPPEVLPPKEVYAPIPTEVDKPEKVTLPAEEVPVEVPPPEEVPAPHVRELVPPEVTPNVAGRNAFDRSRNEQLNNVQKEPIVDEVDQGFGDIDLDDPDAQPEFKRVIKSAVPYFEDWEQRGCIDSSCFKEVPAITETGCNKICTQAYTCSRMELKCRRRPGNQVDLCKGRIATCRKNVDPGNPCLSGASQQTRYFYDYSTRTCQPFSYMGCSGNANNFATESECLGKCDNWQCFLGVWVGHIFCAPGVTKRSGKRWAYHYILRKCLSFAYGGCAGNSNNFASKSACENICKPKITKVD